MAKVVVIGAGIFGITAALTLRKRGHDVTVCDPGPIPHPLAESTDISKVVRLEYGDDETYTEIMETTIERWRTWSARSFFHETGLLCLTQAPVARGTFEGDSYEILKRRGHVVELLDASAIRSRFPAWNTQRFGFGYYNAQGGYAESGRVVAHLAREAADAGVHLRAGVSVAHLLEEGSRVAGVVTSDGAAHRFDFVVLAAGSWAPYVAPSLSSRIRSTGQPVVHFAPVDSAPFDAKRFPVFTADISRTGYYGFPVNRDGLLKIANHGIGRAMHPESEARVVTDEETAAMRTFFDSALSGLRDARIAATRVCVYGDTTDQHFIIAPDPDRPGLVVAAGGSGHGFKFAPILGDLVADALENKVVPKFRWRDPDPNRRGEERSRHQG